MLHKILMYNMLMFYLLLGGTTVKAEWWSIEEVPGGFQNTWLLKRNVKSKLCITQQPNTQWNQQYFRYKNKVRKIGAIVHPNPKSIRRKQWGIADHDFGPNTISISILPYFITNSDKKFYLLPEVPDQMVLTTKYSSKEKRECFPQHKNDYWGQVPCKQIFMNYFPACQVNTYNNLAYEYPEFYPIVLLTVENEKNIKQLEQGLNKKLDINHLEFLASPIALSKWERNKLKSKNGIVNGMNFILQKIFQSKQAYFLRDSPFTVTMEMRDSLRGKIKFEVGGETKKVVKTSSCRDDNRHNEDLKKELQQTTKQLEQTTKQRDDLKVRVEKLKQMINDMIDYDVKEADRRKKQFKDITEGSHGKKFIVVSLSDNYSKSRTNHRVIQNNVSIIKKSFIKVLSQLKQNKSKTQFSLVTIGSGGKVRRLLTSAELATLSDRGNDSIQGQIELNMGFGAEDLKALADLGRVDHMVIDESIKSILYLTDNKRSYSSSNLEQGIPLAWDNAGIHLKVLTIKDCNIWEQVKAQCTSWNNEATLISVLEDFLRQ